MVQTALRSAPPIINVQSASVIARGDTGAIKRIVMAYWSLTAFWLLYLLFPTNGVSLGKFLINSLLVFSYVLITLTSLSSLKINGHADRRATLRLVILLISVVAVTIVARSVDFDVGHLLTLAAHPILGACVWLLPLTYFIGTRPAVVGALLRFFRPHMIIGIIASIITIYDSWILGHYRDWQDLWIQIGPLFLYPAPIILMTNLQPENRALAFVAMVVNIAVNAAVSNRVATVVALFTLILAIVIGRSRNRSRLIAISTLVAVLSATLVTIFRGTLQQDLSSSWLIDTRTFLFTELSADFSTRDWIIGRGALGSYYSPYFRHWAEMGFTGDYWQRQVSEVGYLHLIFKGGILTASLYCVALLLGLMAALRAPNIRVGFGIGYLIAVQLAEMTISGLPQFDFEHLSLWVMMGYAASVPRLPQPKTSEAT